MAHPSFDNRSCRTTAGRALEKQVLLFMHENLLRSGELQTTLAGGEGEDVGRRASTKVEGRSVSMVPRLPDFLKVSEGPVHKAATVPKQGEDGGTDQFHHLSGVVLLALNEGRCLPCAFEDTGALPLESEGHIANSRGI